MRTLLIGALVATLVGCSHEPPPQAAIPSCAGPNPLACLTAVRVPIESVSFGSNSATMEGKSNISWHSDTLARARLAGTTAKSTRRALAAQKANTRDRSDHSEAAEDGKGVKAASASANNTDVPVAVLMARLDIRSVSELTGKTIAIDNRYSAYNRGVKTAIVAAGAPKVQLSEGQTTAMNRLVSGEVPAAVLALVSAEEAESFPGLAGFRIFHIPLSSFPERAAASREAHE